MNRGARGVPGAHGEAAGGLAAGDLTGRLIGLAIKVHKTVGPGLLEQIYEDCLCHESRQGRPETGVPTAIEMALNGLTFQRQVELSLIYDGVRLPGAYRVDIVAGETVILEIKSIEQILPVHEAQLLTYLRLSHCAVGLLLNFNTNLLKDGLRRFVNTFSPRAPGPPRPP
jgi:GxxExxY protein